MLVTSIGTFKNKVELSLALGHSRSYVRCTLKRHPEYTLEDIIAHPRLVRPDGKVAMWRGGADCSLGHFYSDEDLSRHLGMGRGWISNQRYKHPDWSLEDIIDNTEKSKIVCKLGSFKSMTELERAVGRSCGWLSRRLALNPELSIDDVVDKYRLAIGGKPDTRYTIGEIDCKYGKFRTAGELSLFCGKFTTFLYVKMRQHPDWGIDKIIEYYGLRPAELGGIYKSCSCSLGDFKSYEELSTHLGKYKRYVSVTLYQHPGWTLEDVIRLAQGEVTNYVCKLGSFRSLRKLSLAVGYPQNWVACKLHDDPDMSLDDVIDKYGLVLNGKGYKPKGCVREMHCKLGTFKSYAEFSRRCGKSPNFIWNKLRTYATVDEVIDKYNLELED